MAAPRNSLTRGVLLAVAAAVAFGVTTPFIARAGAPVGFFATAALLYAGAALVSLALAPVVARSGTLPGRGDVPRLLGVALFGAALAPVLLVWGIRRTGATTASLALNLEAVFTVLLARVVYREPIGRRVAVAVALMLAASLLVAGDAARGASVRLPGVLAVVGATLAWAADNTLSRGLAECDPGAVVAAKGLLGALATGALAAALGEHRPPLANAALLVACGATGYGLSLRLYLLAQRAIGSARTASVFALGPFVGAALGWALGDRGAGLATLAGAAVFGVGVYLHATERHAHRHAHTALDHEHAHRHDDGHHAHVHVPPVAGEHTHWHHHEPMEHAHRHAPDLHHTHEHHSH